MPTTDYTHYTIRREGDSWEQTWLVAASDEEAAQAVRAGDITRWDVEPLAAHDCAGLDPHTTHLFRVSDDQRVAWEESTAEGHEDLCGPEYSHGSMGGFGI